MAKNDGPVAPVAAVPAGNAPNMAAPGAPAGAIAPGSENGRTVAENVSNETAVVPDQISHDDKKPQGSDGVKELPTKSVAEGRAAVVAASAGGERMVTVRPLEDHETKIGGVLYSFKKGEQQKVPLGVASILQNATKVVLVNY